MRIFSAFFRCFCLSAVLLVLPFASLGSEKPGNVVLQYHFVGATQLAEDTNAFTACRVFALKTTVAFEDLVLNRLAGKLAEALQFPTNKASVALLRPLLDDALRVESMASVGGAPGKPLDFVFAFDLDTDRSQRWQQSLKSVNSGTGEKFQAGSFTGWQWKKGGKDSVWMVPARDWLLVGRGESLASVRSAYLQQIKEFGRPGPALVENCFEADVDWPQLARSFSMDWCPLKLARTQLGISAKGGTFYTIAHVTYPEAIQWQPRPMSFPTNLVREPLLSFATGQNVAPFLKSDDTLSRLCTDPLRDQFYFWSMSELAFESFVAWPVSNPSNTIKTLSDQALAELNPKLHALDGTELKWKPKQMRLVWMNLPMITPSVLRVGPTNGNFLLGALFPLTPGNGTAPPALWAQLEGKKDLVYYDFEFTGPRVRHLLTLTQVLPILNMLGVGPREPLKAGTPAAKSGAKAPGAPAVDPRLTIEEQWLANLNTLLGRTATEVTKTGPNELTVIRNSQFVFSSLELVLLSHWLSDTPAGPIDKGLLPFAKMSGPGIPPE